MEEETDEQRETMQILRRALKCDSIHASKSCHVD